MAAKSMPFVVECFSSENPINAQLWPEVINHTRVQVMTAQVFLNKLDAGDATLETVDLMVSWHWSVWTYIFLHDCYLVMY